jgi:predicted ArsR family transcriptional regulator
MGEGRRQRILALVRASADGLGVAAIAGELGVHPNTVRFHLDALVDAGRIEHAPGAVDGPGRPALVYRAVRTMDRNGRSNYQLLATVLTSYLASASPDPVGDAIELGRRWGPTLVEVPRQRAQRSPRGVRAATKTEAVRTALAVLDDLGFEPEPDQGARTTQLRLRHCPFLDLVDAHAEVICALHLGLIQGMMTASHGPVTADRLEPFVEPDLCVAHLAHLAPLGA